MDTPLPASPDQRTPPGPSDAPLACALYGLGIRLDRPLPGLAGLRAPGVVDVDITLGTLPAAAFQATPSESCFASGTLGGEEPNLRISRRTSDGFFGFQYQDGTRFEIDPEGRRVWAAWTSPATLEDTATYLLGPVLGFVLRLRGAVFLHASVVVLDGRAVAIVGPSRAGKSSTAAAFACLGVPVLTDDIAVLERAGEGVIVQPGYPWVRLWQDSAEALFARTQALPRIVPTWEKRYLDLNRPPHRFQAEPLPLGAVYLLGDRLEGLPEPVVESVTPGAGLIALISDPHGFRLLDGGGRAREFDFLADLVGRVPVRRAVPCAGIERIGELCATIQTDFHALARSGP